MRTNVGILIIFSVYSMAIHEKTLLLHKNRRLPYVRKENDTKY